MSVRMRTFWRFDRYVQLELVARGIFAVGTWGTGQQVRRIVRTRQNDRLMCLRILIECSTGLETVLTILAERSATLATLSVFALRLEFQKSSHRLLRHSVDRGQGVLIVPSLSTIISKHELIKVTSSQKLLYSYHTNQNRSI